MPVYGVSHDPFMAKLPRGGGSGRHDRARNADRSFAHVVVVRISSFPLAAWNEITRWRVSCRLCITPTLRPRNRGRCFWVTDKAERRAWRRSRVFPSLLN